VRARSQALVSADDAAEPLYREAIERLGGNPYPPAAGGAPIWFTAKWLRRANRRADARHELLQAFEMFRRHGGWMRFPGAARRELAATGEKVRTQATERPHDLTKQEAQIARLARERTDERRDRVSSST